MGKGKRFTRTFLVIKLILWIIHDMVSYLTYSMIKFLRSGDSVEKVANCTELPLKEVEKLQKKISH